MKISHHCNALRKTDTGKQVALRGWVDRRRDHGGVIFIDLRDREGKTQVVFNPEFSQAVHKQAEGLRNEFVLYVTGVVRPRPQGMVNPKLPTGEVDVYAEHLQILSTCDTLPIAVNDASEEAVENEEVRLKYRYLDMRRPREQQLIRKKSRFIFAWRKALNDAGFDEIETPILMKSTPEGARDFLVPSRMNPGSFYALPQSPQTYKQLLMVSGFEKYYQVAKCFRDEDLRADRQPEFLQIDCEMSFVDSEDIFNQFETIIQRVMQEVWDYPVTIPFARIPYHEAMIKYGSDKPDLRYELKIRDVTALAGNCGFGVFSKAVASGGVVRGLAAKGCLDFTRKIIDDLTGFVGKFGSRGLVWMRHKEDGVESQVGKFFASGELEKLGKAVGGEPGDMLFFIAGPEKIANSAMGHLRQEIARLKGLADGKSHRFVWITEFPMFEYSETEDRYTAMHHPFTAPESNQIALLDSGKLGDIKAKAYDLVLNGVEVGGGSIRIHDRTIQKKVFSALGLSEEKWRAKFGYLVEAFKYGPPPHGGLAFGVDRFLATLENRHSIRDFIPFPKTSSGTSLLEECPSEVDSEQLRELHIRLVEKP